MKQKKQGKCILVGAGDLTVSEIRYDEQEDFLIAVDGGAMYCEVLEVVPDLCIGDFDSVDDIQLQKLQELKAVHPEKVKELNPQKDDTDMLAALRIGLEKGYETFYLYAATGGRLEHTIANIQCLLFLKHQGAAGYIMDGNGMMLVAENENIQFKSTMEGYLSIFSLGKRAEGVTLKGLKYPLDNYTMTNEYPIGCSNEFIGEEAEVEVKNGQLILIVKF